MRINSAQVFSTLLSLLVSVRLASGQTQVQQLGSSGKFRISDERGASDPNRVTVEVDSVFEVPSDSTDHGTNTVANQDFAISDVESSNVQGIAASKVTFTSDLVTSGGASEMYGTITLEVYIFEEAGTVTTDTESYEVVENDVKFNIYLNNWSFDTNSEFVDVALIIKGRADSENVEEEEENTFDLGGSVPLILSGRVEVDGVETAMPDPYPRYRKTGNKYTFEFRFPKFNTDATYDPLVCYSEAKDGCGNLPAFVGKAWDSLTKFVEGGNW